MYSLDINFLKDRSLTSETPTASGKSVKKSTVIAGQEPLPMIIGGAIAVIALGVVGFSFWQVAEAKTKTEAEIASTDQEIQQLNAFDAKATQIIGETDGLKNQSKAFVDVLQTKIKPWAAILGEIKDLTPPTLQIDSLSFQQAPQTAATPVVPPAPAATPPAAETPVVPPAPASVVLLKGFARNFNDVNDLALNLQASPLFTSDKVYIVKAALVDNPTTLEFKRPVESYNLPKVVEYTVSVNLNDLTDAEIIKTLETQGAKGMAARLKNSF